MASKLSEIAIYPGHPGLSRFTIAAKLSGKTAQETATAIMTIFERLDPCLRRSSTFDDDTAFARHGLLRQALDIKISFHRGVALHC